MLWRRALTAPSVVFTEAVAKKFSVKTLFLKISQNSQENTCGRTSFLKKLQASACNFIEKEGLAQVYPVNFAKILKTFFYRTPLMAASAFLNLPGRYLQIAQQQTFTLITKEKYRMIRW